MSVYIKLSTLEYPRHVGDIALDPVAAARWVWSRLDALNAA